MGFRLVLSGPLIAQRDSDMGEDIILMPV